MHDHTQETIAAGNKLRISLILSLTILVAEIIGGLLSNSLALLSDAGHVFADVVAISLSWYGVRQSLKPSNSRMTFGYHRIGVIVAIINAFVIFVIAGVILYEAYHRFQQPPEVNSNLMMGIAAIGLAANIFVTAWFRREQRHNINIRSVFWHSLGDALASVGVIAGGLIITLTGKFWIDPVVSVLISFIILFAAWSILRDGVNVILEATPAGLKLESMIETLKKVPGVRDVHDVHVWSISPELHAMSGHLLIEDVLTSRAEEIRAKAEKVVQDEYGIMHTTLQTECQACQSPDTFCTLKEAQTQPAENQGK